jgi:hypothetical protein
MEDNEYLKMVLFNKYKKAFTISLFNKYKNILTMFYNKHRYTSYVLIYFIITISNLLFLHYNPDIGHPSSWVVLSITPIINILPLLLMFFYFFAVCVNYIIPVITNIIIW